MSAFKQLAAVMARETPDFAPVADSAAACRGCGSQLSCDDVFADLGHAPLANALLSEDGLSEPEVHYRLLALVCRRCLLVQLQSQTHTAPDLFPASYPFRSGASVSWLAHCRKFADQIKAQLHLGPTARVLEIGSNDGTGLLRFRGLGIPAMGVEPCREVALEALREGLATDIAWWSEDYARTLRRGGYAADLVLARNVLAHVPDLGDFLRGVRSVLAPGGTAVFEVPYVGNLITDGQWDQIYHEHHCYFSLHSLGRALGRAGLWAYDVEHIPVHGGSIRVYARLTDSNPLRNFMSGPAQAAHHAEQAAGLHRPETYLECAGRPAQDKRRALGSLHALGARRVVGYGASAKAVSFLNYCGLGVELIEAVVDTTPAKWGKYLPGSHIPIRHPDWLKDNPTDVVVNFLWNWREESEQRIRDACPEAEIIYLRG